MNPLFAEADPVLIIDDHEDTRNLLVELLELDGFAVVAAASGEEALAVVREQRPCLVLLDLGLPDIAGLELVLRLRSEPNTASAPIYALSGFANLRGAALAAGLDGFLIKPVSGRALRALVQTHCSPMPPPDEVVTQVGPPPTA
jgi:CheY-like chemotaxis protein